MRTIYRVFASIRDKKILCLEKYGLNIVEEDNLFICYFDSDNLYFNKIIKDISSNKLSYFTSVEFNKEEIESSDWIVVESTWTSLYPYPRDINEYLKKTYNLDSYCKGNEPTVFCRLGKKQNSLFHFEKNPRWATRNVMRINWVYEELFVSSKLKSIFEKSSLNGFDFKEIYIKDKDISSDTFQLNILNTLPNCIESESIKEKYTCPICKRSKYLLKKGFIYLNKKIMDNNKFDIIKTSEKIGQVDADSLIIISKRFYKTLVDNKLDRGMNFIPIILK